MGLYASPFQQAISCQLASWARDKPQASLKIRQAEFFGFSVVAS